MTTPPEDQLMTEITTLRQRIKALEAAHARTATALQASERRYQHLMANSLGLLCIHDLDGTLVEINTAAAQALGYHPRDGVGKSLREFLAPSVRSQFDDYLVRIRQHPSDRGFLRFVTRTGEERVWQYHNIRIDEPGQPSCVWGYAQDVTELLRAQQTLEASEERFRHLLEGSIQGIVIHRDFKPLFVNQSYAEIHGYDTADEILQMDSILPLAAPHEQIRWAQYRDARLRGESAPTDYEYQAIHKDGSWIWIDNKVRVVTWDGASAIQSTAFDVTERKQAEAALHGLHETLAKRVMARTAALNESEARFRNLIEGSLQGIMIHRDDQALFVNEAYANIFGYETPEEILRLDSLLPLIAPHEQERLLGYRDARLAGQTVPPHYEYQGVRQNGSRVWLDHTVRVVSWDGQPATQSIVMDISERKQLQIQLNQMQKMDAIGTLASGVAHEFNNMLSAILGFTQLAVGEVSPTSSVSQHLQFVDAAGNRAKELVQQLLTFSRPSAPEREPISLSQVVQDTLRLLRPSLPTTIEIQLYLTPDQVQMLANPNQMHQVLLNLYNNAEYAMRETGGILEIIVDTLEVKHPAAAFHLDLQPGPYVRLRVKDSGPGIPPDIINRIFEPFFTTKGIGDGTGMGLAVVHGIITSHGGAITVESEPGEGSTFTVYLPQIDDESALPTRALEPSMPQGEACILFVDDEEVLARLGQALLERLGYEVVVHTSSLAALKAFQTEPDRFDLVITDQTMPAMTGATLVEELRQVRADIPVILCTGFSHLVNDEKATALGVDAFVMKPGVTQELAVTIQQVLAKRSNLGT